MWTWRDSVIKQNLKRVSNNFNFTVPRNLTSSALLIIIVYFFVLSGHGAVNNT